jgi:membrane protease YdiL (CAAX protease family)
MTELPAEAALPPLPWDRPLPPPPPPRNWGVDVTLAVLAWAVVVGLVLFARFPHAAPREFTPPAVQPPAGMKPPPDARDVILSFQCRAILGLKELTMPAQKAQVVHDAEMLNTGPVNQRLRAIVLLADLDGPERGTQLLQDLDRQLREAGHWYSGEQAEERNVLGRLYADHAAGHRADPPSVGPEERDGLREKMGWFGALALAPEGGDPDARAEVLRLAMQTGVALLVAIVAVIGGLLAGLVGLVVVLVGFLTGWLRGGLAVGSNHGGVYAETFALWMTLFVALQVVAGQFVFTDYYFLLLLGTFAVSLVVLAWPVLRGVPWRQVRQDLGLTFGRGLFRELALGPVCYAMTLPLVAVGVVVTLIMLKGAGFPLAVEGDPFQAPALPAHPIVGVLVGGSWWVRVQVLLLGSVAAPIVEETMFRGVLYRHLREGSRWLGRFLSVAFSAVLGSFLFAAIHPQGAFGIPLLMSLAIGLCLAREWRGSLLPSMVMHGMSNGMVMLLLIASTGG